MKPVETVSSVGCVGCSALIVASERLSLAEWNDSY